MDLTEGVGESSSPPRSFISFNNYDVRSDVYNRLVESGHEEALSRPEFRDLLDAHFNRLPASYGLDVNMDRVEDVLIHQKLLALAKDPEKRPVYHIRFLESISSTTDDNEDEQFTSSVSTSRPSCDETNEGAVTPHDRNCAIDFEPCCKLGDLNLDVRKNTKDMNERDLMENFPRRQDRSRILTHEVIFSSIDKPKLLSQLSALLSDIGLNIREAHVFSTTDGYSLDVFVVDGWPVEDTDGLNEAMEKAVARSEGSWSRSSHSHSAVEKVLAAKEKPGNCKKWRCSKDAYPDSKYCERHMHRGRNRSRKPVESQTMTQSSSTVTSLTVTGTSSGTGSFQNLPLNAFGNTQSTGSGTNQSHYQIDSIPFGIPNKDYRYLQGLKPEIGEHSFLSDTSGSNRGLQMDSPLDSTWPLMPSRVASFPASKSGDGSILHNDYPQHSFFNNDFPSGEHLRQEGQSLRPFFDEWPKGRDTWSGLEDERSNQTSFSTTQLSISIPMTSSDFSATSSRSPHDN